MQQIGRDFPAHYRDAIEQYFRRLATEEENSKIPPKPRDVAVVPQPTWIEVPRLACPTVFSALLDKPAVTPNMVI